MLTTRQCIEQLRRYAEAAETLNNKERAIGLKLAADFLEEEHQDCAASQQTNPADSK